MVRKEKKVIVVVIFADLLFGVFTKKQTVLLSSELILVLESVYERSDNYFSKVSVFLLRFLMGCLEFNHSVLLKGGIVY